MTVPQAPRGLSTNHYTLLGLPLPTESTVLSAQTIKRAYHRALLRHHPDKSHSKPTAPSSTTSAAQDSNTPTIDNLALAYTTLTTPSLRSDYDRSLILSSKPSSTIPHSAPEQVDLDDMRYIEDEAGWFKECRCGAEGGFLVLEEELEEVTEEGAAEVLVGCRGCSLWVRVGFAVIDGR